MKLALLHRLSSVSSSPGRSSSNRLIRFLLLNVVIYFWTVIELTRPGPPAVQTVTVLDPMSCTLSVDPLLDSSHRECRRPNGNLHVKWGCFRPQTGGAGSTTEPSGSDPPVPSHNVHLSPSVKHQKVWKWCKRWHLWSVCVCVFAEVWSSHSHLLFSSSSGPFRDVTPVPQLVLTRTTFPSLSKVKDFRPYSHFVLFKDM